jgi:flagellar hook-associated protein 1 FlgK
MSASLNAILSSANSGMRAAQAGLDVVSRNVSNAATEGYTRKEIQLENRVVGLVGAGVATGDVQRTVNKSLQKEIWRGNSDVEALRVKEDFLARLELGFGSPGDDNSVASMLGSLGNAFRKLVTQPDSSTQQQAVLGSARAFARSANDLSNTIQNLRLDAERNIKDVVDAINRVVTQISETNDLIVQARGMGQSTADLEDRRDGALKELAKSIDIVPFERPSGEVWLLTANGRLLLDGQPSTLSFNAMSAMNPAMTYGSGLNGVQLGGVDITNEIAGGKLAGLFQTRDASLVQAQGQLDEMNARVAQSFALTGLDLFDYAARETVVTGRTAAAGAAVGATSFTVSSAVGVAVGMNLRFSNHAQTYEVTAVAGTTITIAPATGSGTGLEIGVPAGTSMVFAAQPGAGSIGFSRLIAVNPTVEAQPWRLRDGTVVAAPGALAQDNAIPRAVVDAFDRIQPFTAAVGLGDAMTLSAFAGTVIAAQSIARATLGDDLEARRALNLQLENRFSSDSGVNIDQELALMIQIQNSYAAAAKVLQSVQSMFDDLIGTVR